MTNQQAAATNIASSATAGIDQAILNATREERGKMIALRGRIKQVGRRYVVPSQTRGGDVGSYLVDLVDEKCTCPDFELTGMKCKHQHAVEWSFILEQTVDADGTVTETVTVKKKQYRQAPGYTEAQIHEKEHVERMLRALCDGIVEPPAAKTGRPRKPLKEKVFAALDKVLTGWSSRRAQSDLKACKKNGLVLDAVSYAEVCRTLENPAVAPILKAMIEESASVLKPFEDEMKQFAIDSTGFGTTMYGNRWLEEKYVEKTTKLWVKLHAFVGTRTGVVTACDVTSAGDCPMLPPLLAATARRFEVDEVSADKAYLADYNVKAIHALGATPYIPFKENSTGQGSEEMREMYARFMIYRPAFLDHYHRRSRSETTFWSIKSKLGSSVRSKLPVSQANEVYAKVLLHNCFCIVRAIYESGLAPKFWQNGGSANPAPAPSSEAA